MELPREAGGHSSGILHICPTYYVPGSVRTARDAQICRCFSVTNASTFIWGQDTPSFRQIPLNTAICQITCGATHVALLTAQGQVYTFGGNEVSQCGLGKDAVEYVSEPSLVSSLVQYNVTSIVCGPSQSAAIVSNRDFFTWGFDSAQQKCVETPSLFRQWSAIGDSKELVQLQFGQQHTALLVRDSESRQREIWVWGSSPIGQLASGVENDTKRHPSRVALAEDILQFSVSESHTLALGKSEVYAWGRNDSSVLGINSEKSIVPYPSPVGGFEQLKLIQVVAGIGYSMAVTDKGDVFSWGKNTQGQLGCPEAPAFTTSPAMIEHFKQNEEGVEVCFLMSGGNHSVALTTDRRAYLWGCGAEYCINPASCDDSPFPTVLAANPVGIALGSNFTVTMFGELTKVMEVPPAPQVASELPDLRSRKSPGPRTLDDLTQEDEDDVEQRPRGKSLAWLQTMQTKNEFRPAKDRVLPASFNLGTTKITENSSNLTPPPNPSTSPDPRANAVSPLPPPSSSAFPKSTSATSSLPTSPPLVNPPTPASIPPRPAPLSSLSLSATLSQPRPASAAASLPPPSVAPLPPSLPPGIVSPPPPSPLPPPLSQNLSAFPPPLSSYPSAPGERNRGQTVGSHLRPTLVISKSHLDKQALATLSPHPPSSASIPLVDAPDSRRSPTLPSGGVRSPKSPVPSINLIVTTHGSEAHAVAPLPPPLPLESHKTHLRSKRPMSSIGLPLTHTAPHHSNVGPQTNALPALSPRSGPPLSLAKALPPPIVPLPPPEFGLPRLTPRSTVIALPRQVMGQEAELPVVIEVQHVTGLSKSYNVMVVLSKDAQSSKNSAFRTQPVAPSKHTAAWNTPFQLSVTPTSSAWFLYLEAMKEKGNVVAVARFNVHIHSMKNLQPNIPLNLELNDPENPKVRLFVSVITSDWCPSVTDPDVVPSLAPRPKFEVHLENKPKEKKSRPKSNLFAKFSGQVSHE